MKSDKSNKLRWEFAPTGGGTETGYEDPVTTRFEGYIPYYLSRESIQNIIDQAIKFPVRAEFSLFTTRGGMIPESDQLKSILLVCKEYYPNNKKAEKFFKNAIELLTRGTDIPVLQIGDYNTTGLSGGNNDKDGNYYNLMKSLGSCAKAGGKGGAFGLGKGAYFAASAFRTMFVSSIYEKNKCVFQGKLRLVSHESNGQIKQGDGSFGLPGQLPVRDHELIPAMFGREEQGTDIYILGFEGGEDWQEKIIKSVLNNFWCAIFNNKLIVKVEDTQITKDNLNELMGKYFIEGEVDTKDNPNPLPYYGAYTYESKNHVFKKSLPTLGDVEFYVLEGENLPKKVACIRGTGMVICNKRVNFINPYAGVFICNDPEGNDILSDMENPAHDQWDVENAKDSEKPQSVFRAADKELKQFIKDSLKEIQGSPGTVLPVLGLPSTLSISSLPPLDSEGGMGAAGVGTASQGETGIETGTIEREVAVTPSKRMKIPKPPPPRPEEETVIPNMKCRSFAIRSKGNAVEHILIIRGPKNKKFKLKLRAGTEDSFYALNIIKALDFNRKKYLAEGGVIHDLETTSTGELKLKVIFETNEKYSLNIEAYESR